MGKREASKDRVVRLKHVYSPSESPVVDCQAVDDGMTDQSQAKACDINELMKRYEATGLLPDGKGSPRFGDVGYGDFQSDMNKVLAAQEAFEALPAGTRKRFNNSPAALIEWMSDNKNYDEAVKLGLLDDEKVAKRAAAKVPVIGVDASVDVKKAP